MSGVLWSKAKSMLNWINNNNDVTDIAYRFLSIKTIIIIFWKKMEIRILFWNKKKTNQIDLPDFLWNQCPNSECSSSTNLNKSDQNGKQRFALQSILFFKKNNNIVLFLLFWVFLYFFKKNKNKKLAYILSITINYFEHIQLKSKPEKKRVKIRKNIQKQTNKQKQYISLTNV